MFLRTWGSFKSTDHKKDWVPMSQIRKMPQLRKVRNLTNDLLNLFADRPPLQAHAAPAQSLDNHAGNMYEFITAPAVGDNGPTSNLCFLLVNIFLSRPRCLTFTDDAAVVPVDQGDEGRHHQRPEKGGVTFFIPWR